MICHIKQNKPCCRPPQPSKSHVRTSSDDFLSRHFVVALAMMVRARSDKQKQRETAKEVERCVAHGWVGGGTNLVTRTGRDVREMHVVCSAARRYAGFFYDELRNLTPLV